MINKDDLEKTHKECITCKVYKFHSDFYIRKDGIKVNECRECTRIRLKRNEKIRLSDPIKHEKELKRIREYMAEKRADPNWVNRSNREPERKYREMHPKRVRMYDMIYKKIKRGELIKHPCQICDDLKSEAHHEDYDKPYDIIWLCRKHHREIHRTYNNILERIKPIK